MITSSHRHVTLRIAATLACSLLLACDAGHDADGRPEAAPAGSVDLTGAGATFPYPLYARWFSDYANATGVRINYQSIGSGGGLRQLAEGTVDFGASESPVLDPDLAAAGGNVLFFPTVAGAIAVTYHLPGLAQPLRLGGEVLADIFLGRITRWNDPRLAALNPGVRLPATNILVVYRSDGSGTTYVFTEYLAARSRAWASGPGTGLQVRWPVGLGGKGNEGVAGTVKQTPGAVGYVELAYAKQNRLPVAAVRNRAGNFVLPSVETVAAAVDAVVDTLPPQSDYRVSVVDAPSPDAYPISSFTWLLVHERQADSAKGREIVDFIRWAVERGDPQARALYYAPLPPVVAERVVARLGEVRLGRGR
jgi:phosphate transport system substrate-binding protein